MRKRLLIAGGCSYTDPNFKSITPDNPRNRSWAMWPEHLASKLGLGNYNVAHSGNCNLSIFESVLKAITLHEDRVEAVVVLWSGWDRSLLFNMFPLCTINNFHNILRNTNQWDISRWIKDSKFHEAFLNFVNSDSWDPICFLRDSINRSLALMYTLATICESKNIKYVFYQGVDPIPIEIINDMETDLERPSGRKFLLNTESILREIQRCPYSGKLENRKDKIIGWPFLEALGGNFVDILRYKMDRRNSPFKGPMNVSLLDLHPNAEAQIIISDIFYDRWKTVYV